MRSLAGPVAAVAAALALLALPRCTPSSRPDPCRGVSCSGYGICVLEADSPRCVCMAGYHPVFLACVPDAADADADAPADGLEAGDAPGEEPGAGDGDVGGDSGDPGADEEPGAEEAAPDGPPPEDDGEHDPGSEEVEPPPSCGDGRLAAGEICDDGNTESEPCYGHPAGACLSDCSLRMADCGDGGLDPGEACDDGNLDEFDDCTTSCTANDHGIGAPCACVDGCDDFDFSAGAIVGCGGVAAPPDGAAVPACIRAVEIPVFGYRVYAAGGYCSLYATGCAGAGCAVVPVVGDVDEFTCPEGAVPRTIVVDTGLVVVTTKHCAVPCETQADCRWNATEETRPDGGRICGQWRCLYDPETVSFACVDPRNG